MTHSQPAAHRGFPLIFMVRYLWSMGVYTGHFRKLERALPESINITDLYRRLQRITDGEGILRRAQLQLRKMREPTRARSCPGAAQAAR